MNAVDLAGEVWGAMLFPSDPAKKAAFAARQINRAFPDYLDGGGCSNVDPKTLAAVMRARDGVDLSRAEIRDALFRGSVAGAQLAILFAIANTCPSKASWKLSEAVVSRSSGQARSAQYAARRHFLPVIHLWGAWELRGRRFHWDETCGYSAQDDLAIFLVEAMALAQWARGFRLDRKNAKSPLSPNDELWTTPPSWNQPAPEAGWPRDGRLAAATIDRGMISGP